MNSERAWPIGAKVAVAIVLGLAGLVFPILLIPAVLILLGIGGDGKPAMREQSPAASRVGVTGAEPDWKLPWIQECESPAEEAFLNAAIEHLDLTPDKGSLRNGQLILQLQVLIDRYRVDFLLNERLVVEVDGAAYHSSPSQVERDRVRDNYLHSLGLSVLRIPATVVLRQPRDAIQRVRTALTRLPPIPTPAPEPAFFSQQNLKDTTKALTSAAASVGPLLDKLNLESAKYLEAQRTRKEPPRPRWLDDSEFERQLAERVAARLAAADPNSMQFDITGVMRSMRKERYTEEEQKRLLKEWDSRAASVPTDPDFHRQLAARVDSLVAAHKFRPGFEEFLRATGTLELHLESIRAQFRWEEEGRLVEEWSRSERRFADDEL